MVRRRAISDWVARMIGEGPDCPARLRHAEWRIVGGGSVHEALEAAGALPAIDRPDGEEAQEWIGRTDWSFRASVEVDHEVLAEGRVDLCFDWIDTCAEIRVNGCRVGVSGSEFVPVRLPVRAWLRPGGNTIEVRIRGPIAAVEAIERRLGTRPVNGDWTPYPFLRKCASNFGWDWGPRSATVGLGGARLEAWSGGRIATVRPLVTRCDEREAVVEVHVEVERSDDRPLVAIVELAGAGDPIEVAIDAMGRGVGLLRVAHPRRWWPRGMGEQTLHALRVRLADESSEIWEQPIGLRSVRLLTTPDEIGARFAIEVNGREIWCRGANWVPRRPCPRRAVGPLLAGLEAAAADANLNMLRVWGGGIYECDAFYAACDRHGILVWQDFMFACATYPEEPPYPELIEAEARHQIARLACHPSVVLWCGGNEDVLAWWSWGWQERLRPGQTWGRRYWLDLLPRLVAELDPTRPYWPESPYSGSMDRHPNDPNFGDRHTWDVRLEAMRSIVPRFCSEFGHQSPPCLGSLRSVLPPTDWVVGSGELARRQRAWGGDGVQYGPFLAERFSPLDRLDDWVFAAHLLQARTYEAAILWMRANAPRCMGALFWQWNDVWIGHSWSVLDGQACRKPAWFAVRRACRALALTLLPPDVEGGGRVVLCRAAGEVGAGEPPGEVRLRLLDADGSPLLDDTLLLTEESPWIAAARVPLPFFAPAERPRALLVADHASGRARHCFVPDREAIFDAEAMEARPEADGSWVVTAGALLRDLCVVDPGPVTSGWSGNPLLEQAAGEGMLTLLPGETIRIPMPGIALQCPTAIRTCLRAANGLGRSSR